MPIPKNLVYNNSMGKIALPNRGQPLDVTFIYTIVKSINDVWEELTKKSSSYSSLWTPDGQKNVYGSEVKIITGRVKIGASDVTTDSFQEFSYVFDVPFGYPPVVTVTPSATDATDAAKNAYAVITQTTESQIKGYIKFENKGKVDISINIVAIGIPG